jgi:putative molybdopterin biosynthesis protein
MVNQLMNTKEVAQYLRLKERSIYALVAQQRIPFNRVTGKLLFPKELIDAWLLDHAEGVPTRPAIAVLPNVIAGSHDPLLEWAVQESGSELAPIRRLLAGLERLAQRRAVPRPRR